MEILSNECPLFAISEHYVKYHLSSQRDLEVLLQILKSFVARGVPLNRRSFEDVTLLHDAVRLGDHNLELIKFLVSNGVDTTVKVEGEFTAMDIALEIGRNDIVWLLDNEEIKEPDGY